MHYSKRRKNERRREREAGNSSSLCFVSPGQPGKLRLLLHREGENGADGFLFHGIQLSSREVTGDGQLRLLLLLLLMANALEMVEKTL